MEHTKRRILRVIEAALLGCLSLLFVAPFLWMIVTALKQPDEALLFPPTLVPENLNWSSFTAVWQAGPFAMYIKNSILIVAAICLAQVLTMIPAAYVFARYEFKGKNLLFLALLLTMTIPSQLTFVPLYLMMSSWQLLDSLFPLIIPFIVSPFGVFLLRQHIMQLPSDMFEAAKIDGANELQIMKNVLMPMIKPALITVLLLSFIAHWNDYFWPLVMTNSVELRTLPLGVANLKGSEGNLGWNVIMAANCMLTMPLVILYALNTKRIKESFAFTGVK